MFDNGVIRHSMELEQRENEGAFKTRNGAVMTEWHLMWDTVSPYNY